MFTGYQKRKKLNIRGKHFPKGPINMALCVHGFKWNRGASLEKTGLRAENEGGHFLLMSVKLVKVQKKPNIVLWEMMLICISAL